MMDTEHPSPPPSPSTQTATKNAISSDVHLPRNDDVSPLSQRALFHRAAAADSTKVTNHFRDVDESLLTCGCHIYDPAHRFDEPAVSATRCVFENTEEGYTLNTERFQSPQKRQKSADSTFCPPSDSVSLLRTSESMQYIRCVGDIPDSYFAEEDDSDFDEEHEHEHENEEDNTRANERTTDPNKMASNRKAILNNNVFMWARSDVLSAQPPIPSSDNNFKKFMQKFSTHIHKRFMESRQSSSTTGTTNSSMRST